MQALVCMRVMLCCDRGAEIDCATLAELPEDVQKEIGAALMLPSKPGGGGVDSRGSSGSSSGSKRGRGRGRGGRQRSPPVASKDLLAFFAKKL